MALADPTAPVRALKQGVIAPATGAKVVSVGGSGGVPPSDVVGAMSCDYLRQVVLEQTLETKYVSRNVAGNRDNALLAQGVAGSNPVAPTTFRVHRSHIGHSSISRFSRGLQGAWPADEHRLFAWS